MSKGNTPISSNIDENETICPLCGKAPLCGGIGWVRRDLPVGHPDFGKMFRCPNNPPEADTGWQNRLRALSNLSAHADKTFDSFEVEIPNYSKFQQANLERALDQAMKFVENPAGWLLFSGTYGCGKTHLAAAIGNARLEKGDLVLFVTVPDLLDHLRSAYGPSSEIGYDETFERIRNAPLLILDDLGVENPSPWAQEKLFQLMNHRYSHGLPTVVTTNSDIEEFDARLRSRLMDNSLVKPIRIQAPDFRPIGSSAHPARFQRLLSEYGEMTFENFKTDTNAFPEDIRNLRKALSVARSYAEKPEDFLLFMGKPGTGKTHLAAAIALYWEENYAGEVMLVPVPDLLDYLRVAFNPDSRISLDKRIYAVRTVPLLVLDDLDTKNATQWAKEKLFQILDYRYVTRLPTVITTTQKLEEIDERIGVRLLDRRRCVLFSIKVKSYAERIKQTGREIP